MPSVIKDFEYDIFISYRQNDNRREGWVTQFVEYLRDELEATTKEKINIYFDANQHDGLHETHQVIDSLKGKLNCLIFIPIISKTYCDPTCFAWEHEFMAFKEMAQNDRFGLKIALLGGNTASRILPVRIHDLSLPDQNLLEAELGHLRSVDFVYSSAGVNRPLNKEDHPERNTNGTIYRDQLNKVANAIDDLIAGMRAQSKPKIVKEPSEKESLSEDNKKRESGSLSGKIAIRPAISYIIISLILIQILQILKDTLLISDQFIFISTVVLVALFPLSVLLALRYERSPHGFIRSGSNNASKNPYSERKKKPLTSNTFIGLISVTLVALFLLFSGKVTDESVSLDKSIAVLSFKDMSPDGDQEHFSDGISEELINALSRLPELKVVGRTSSFYFKGKNVNLKDIGEELGVSNILDGSIRKSGNKLRVSVQLVNTKDGFSLWNKTYNVEISDAFTIQDEITSAIIKELEIQLTDGEKDFKIAKTSSITAYELYLTARQKLAARNEGILEARDLFTQVIELDPDYSPAYSGLGRALALTPGWFTIKNADEIYTQAKTKALKALKLNPENAEAYSVLGSVALFYEWDWEEARKNFERSYELNPNDAEIINFLGDFYSYTGHPKGIEIETKAMQVDPLHPAKYNDLSFAYLFTRNGEMAAEMAIKAIELDSFLLSPVGNYINAQYLLNNLAEAKNMFESYSVKGNDASVRENRAFLAAWSGDSEAIKISERDLLQDYESGATDAVRLAEFYYFTGDHSSAAKWVDISYENKEYYLIGSYYFFMPEDMNASEELLAALDKPGLNSLFELRRRNREMKVLRR